MIRRRFEKMIVGGAIVFIIVVEPIWQFNEDNHFEITYFHEPHIESNIPHFDNTFLTEDSIAIATVSSGSEDYIEFNLKDEN